MTKLFVRIVFRSFLLLALAVGLGAAFAEKTPLPGRQVKVPAICIGFGGDHDHP